MHDVRGCVSHAYVMVIILRQFPAENYALLRIPPAPPRDNFTANLSHEATTHRTHHRCQRRHRPRAFRQTPRPGLPRDRHIALGVHRRAEPSPPLLPPARCARCRQHRGLPAIARPHVRLHRPARQQRRRGRRRLDDGSVAGRLALDHRHQRHGRGARLARRHPSSATQWHRTADQCRERGRIRIGAGHDLVQRHQGRGRLDQRNVSKRIARRRHPGVRGDADVLSVFAIGNISRSGARAPACEQSNAEIGNMRSSRPRTIC